MVGITSVWAGPPIPTAPPEDEQQVTAADIEQLARAGDIGELAALYFKRPEHRYELTSALDQVRPQLGQQVRELAWAVESGELAQVIATLQQHPEWSEALMEALEQADPQLHKRVRAFQAAVNSGDFDAALEYFVHNPEQREALLAALQKTYPDFIATLKAVGRSLKLEGEAEPDETNRTREAINGVDAWAKKNIDAFRSTTPVLNQGAQVGRAVGGLATSIAVGVAHLAATLTPDGIVELEAGMRRLYNEATADGLSAADARKVRDRTWEVLKQLPPALVEPIRAAAARGDYTEAGTRAVLEVGLLLVALVKGAQVAAKSAPIQSVKAHVLQNAADAELWRTFQALDRAVTDLANAIARRAPEAEVVALRRGPVAKAIEAYEAELIRRGLSGLPDELQRFSFESVHWKTLEVSERTITLNPPHTRGGAEAVVDTQAVVDRNLRTYVDKPPEDIYAAMDAGYVLRVEDPALPSGVTTRGLAVATPDYDGRLLEAYLGQVVSGVELGNSGKQASQAALAVAKLLKETELGGYTTGGKARDLYVGLGARITHWNIRTDYREVIERAMQDPKVMYVPPPEVHAALHAVDPVYALHELPATVLKTLPDNVVEWWFKFDLRDPSVVERVTTFMRHPVQSTRDGITYMNRVLNPLPADASQASASAMQAGWQARIANAEVTAQGWQGRVQQAMHTVGETAENVSTAAKAGILLTAGGLAAMGEGEVYFDLDSALAPFNAAPGSDSIALHVPRLGFLVSAWYTGPYARGPIGVADDPAMPFVRWGAPPTNPGAPTSLTGVWAARAGLQEIGAGVQWFGNNEEAWRTWVALRLFNGAANLRADVPTAKDGLKGLSALTSATPWMPVLVNGFFYGPAGVALRRDTELDPNAAIGPAKVPATTPVKSKILNSWGSVGGVTTGVSSTFLTTNPAHGKPEPGAPNVQQTPSTPNEAAEQATDNAAAVPPSPPK